MLIKYEFPYCKMHGLEFWEKLGAIWWYSAALRKISSPLDVKCEVSSSVSFVVHNVNNTGGIILKICLLMTVMENITTTCTHHHKKDCQVKLVEEHFWISSSVSCTADEQYTGPSCAWVTVVKMANLDREGGWRERGWEVMSRPLPLTSAVQTLWTPSISGHSDWLPDSL